MPVVWFNGQRVEAAVGSTLFDTAEAAPHARREISSSCPRAGRCRECIVCIRSGADALTPLQPVEEFLVSRADADGGTYRLACQARIARAGALIEVETFHRKLAIATTGREVDVRLDPWVRREGGELVCGGRRLGPWRGPLYGAAIDVGTTTVVLHVVDLETGATLQVRAFENPQRYGGSNVIHRICYDRDRRGQLRQTLVGHLNDVLSGLGFDPRAIGAVTVAGNSTMRDLFFGLDVQAIGSSPFMSLTQSELLAGRRDTTALWAEAAEIGLSVHPRAAVYGLPLVSHHVGADMAAVLATIPREEHQRPFLILDIGTNTEVAVGIEDRIVCASCPAGPAFEGGRLSCGTAASDGAIAHLWRRNGKWDLEVIGDTPPRGFCGSGLVDVLAELLNAGEMDGLGHLADGASGVVVSRDPLVRFTRRDAAELAQAKAANALGQAVLLRKLGLEPSALETCYLAGAFASHLNVANAQRIGLLLPLPPERVVSIGNASVEGAKAALLSREVRDRIEILVRRIEHVELENEPDFFHLYTEYIQFEPIATR